MACLRKEDIKHDFFKLGVFYKTGETFPNSTATACNTLYVFNQEKSLQKEYIKHDFFKLRVFYKTGESLSNSAVYAQNAKVKENTLALLKKTGESLSNSAVYAQNAKVKENTLALLKKTGETFPNSTATACNTLYVFNQEKSLQKEDIKHDFFKLRVFYKTGETFPNSAVYAQNAKVKENTLALLKKRVLTNTLTNTLGNTLIKTLVKVLILLFFLLFSFISYAEDGIQPSGGASLDQARNGVPIINIEASNNGQGISHNRYERLSISKAGVIFNNSYLPGNSLLGGYIFGNPNWGDIFLVIPISRIQIS